MRLVAGSCVVRLHMAGYNGSIHMRFTLELAQTLPTNVQIIALVSATLANVQIMLASASLQTRLQ